MTAICDICEETTRLGDVVESDYIDVAVWRKVLEASGSYTGYIRLERWKTVGEVYKELMPNLDVWQCSHCCEEFSTLPGSRFDCTCCGTVGSLFELVDEYFGTTGMNEDMEWPHGKRCNTVVHVSTGASEGHRYEVGVVIYGNPSTYFPVFGGKTFLGMEHAQDMAARIVRLLGV